jgi:hypothetical protein
MHDSNVILRDMFPLEGQDLAGPHAGEQGQPKYELFAKIEDAEDLLDLVRRENPP